VGVSYQNKDLYVLNYSFAAKDPLFWSIRASIVILILKAIGDNTEVENLNTDHKVNDLNPATARIQDKKVKKVNKFLYLENGKNFWPKCF